MAKRRTKSANIAPALRRKSTEPYLTFNERQVCGLLSQYEDVKLEADHRKQITADAADKFIRSMQFRNNLVDSPGLDGREIQTAVNLAVDRADCDADFLVVSRMDYLQMRDMARAMYGVLADIVEVIDKTKGDLSGNQGDSIADIVRDAQRQNSQYCDAMGFMPDVCRNADG